MTRNNGGPVRFALVGTGAIAQLHACAFRDFPDDVHLAAVCDVRAEAAEAVAMSIPTQPAVFTDFEEMLEKADIDAVDLCTPHFLHAPHTIAAASAGKHVLVEKPMACSIEESEAMVAAASSASVTLMVAQYLRYLPDSRALRGLIQSGGLGQPWFARADNWFGHLDESHAWAYDAKLSGGGVFHMGATHHVDLFRYYFGEVGAVRARTWTDDPRFKNGAEDRAVATLEFESGVVAQLSAGYLPYETLHKHQYAIFGETAGAHTAISAESDPFMAALWQHRAPVVVASATGDVSLGPAARLAGEPPATYEPLLPFVTPWVTEVLHFARCVRGEDRPLSEGVDNVETMRAVYACYEAARTGKEVRPADF